MKHDNPRFYNHRRCLLLDDDRDYVRTLERAALRLNLRLIGCSNVDDFILESLKGNYAAAIIDYNLDAVQFKGDELARLVEFSPVFIISADPTAVQRIKYQDIRCAAGFLSKRLSPRSILKVVRDTIDPEREPPAAMVLGNSWAA